MARTGQPQDPVSTPQRILDAAEELFAEHGFDGVSIRQITARAGVELALANYHFGPKQDLFVAVITRRADALNSERRRLLEALPEPPTVEGLIDAFSRPFLEKSVHGGPGWKSYARLIAQTANAARWTRDIMTAQFDPIAEVFLAGMRRALPGAQEEDLYWGFHFLVGAMTLMFAETGRIDALSGGRFRAGDLERIHARLVPFMAAGYRALAEVASGNRASRK
ncbi:MAG: TetR/AcrR family transcriptional regulator [Gammaproteobacteria bacterium]|nr:TetR/AcrR family transcriptional regulator [Gammaproteobacteria bacterium]